MRLHIILLSSVALALLVQAEENPTGATNIQTFESPKEIPVGKGIVYTKTSFFKNQRNQRNEQEDNSTPSSSNEEKKEGGKSRSIADAGRETLKSASDFATNLLGIDLGINIGGDKKKKKDTTPDKDAPGYAWYNTPLYGDDGYVPRPVPFDCDNLPFRDQMIWDQQGNAGAHSGTDSTGGNNKQDASVPAEPSTKEDDTKSLADNKNVDASVAPEDKKENTPIVPDDKKVDTPVPEDKKIDTPIVPEEKKEDTPIVPEEKKEDTPIVPDDKKDDKTITEDQKDTTVTLQDGQTVDASEANREETVDVSKGDADKESKDAICILGICIGGKHDDDDDDDDDDDKSGKSHPIAHKQKKFLRQFRGKSLLLDPSTGCPIAGSYS